MRSTVATLPDQLRALCKVAMAKPKYTQAQVARLSQTQLYQAAPELKLKISPSAIVRKSCALVARSACEEALRWPDVTSASAISVFTRLSDRFVAYCFTTARKI